MCKAVRKLTAQRKEPTSVALLGLIRSDTKGMSNYLVTIICSAQIFVFPTINRIKALSLTEYLYYTVALPKIGNHRVIHSQGCEIAYNVRKYITEEALNGVNMM